MFMRNYVTGFSETISMVEFQGRNHSPTRWINRLKFSKKFINKDITFQHTSNNVTFLDGSKCDVFGSDGYRYVWRKSNREMSIKNWSQTIKHGDGFVMLFCGWYITTSGTWNFVFIDDALDKYKYLNILRNH